MIGLQERLSWMVWLRVSHEVAVKVSARTWLWLKGLLPRWLIHMASGWQEASAPLHVDPTTRLLECPCNMAAGFLRANDPTEQNENHNVFYNLALKVTLLNFHNILVITQDSLIQFGGGWHDGVNTRKWGSLGAFLEPGYYNSVGQDWQQARVDSLGGKGRGRQ